MKTPAEFATDVRLTFQNALTYGMAIQVGMLGLTKCVLGVLTTKLMLGHVGASLALCMCRSGPGKNVQMNLLDLAQHLLKFFDKVSTIPIHFQRGLQPHFGWRGYVALTTLNLLMIQTSLLFPLPGWVTVQIWAKYKQRLKPKSQHKVASAVKPKNKSPTTKKTVTIKSKVSTFPERQNKALSQSTKMQPMRRNLSVPKIQLKIVMSKTVSFLT